MGEGAAARTPVPVPPEAAPGSGGLPLRVQCALVIALLFFVFLLHSLRLSSGVAQPQHRPVNGLSEAHQLPAHGVLAPAGTASGGSSATVASCIRAHLRPRPLDFSWAEGGPLIPAPRIAVIGMFKNEAVNMREWLEHYLEQGIEHFLLLDNDSSDAWQGQLAGFEDVTKVVSSTLVHAQVMLYNSIAVPWLQSQGIELALIVDLDEFAFSTKPGRTLAELAWGIFNHSDTSKIATVHMAWALFGSSGHVEQPPSVREGFTQRKVDSLAGLGKSFARLSMVDSLNIHVHASATGVRVDEPISTMLGFQLNHYAIQSKRWFEATKMTRGDSGSATLDNVRNWEYFAKYDFKEMEDRQLLDVAKGWRSRHPECYSHSK